jgi:hypothetical protein
VLGHERGVDQHDESARDDEHGRADQSEHVGCSSDYRCSGHDYFGSASYDVDAAGGDNYYDAPE